MQEQITQVMSSSQPADVGADVLVSCQADKQLLDQLVFGLGELGLGGLAGLAGLGLAGLGLGELGVWVRSRVLNQNLTTDSSLL